MEASGHSKAEKVASHGPFAFDLVASHPLGNNEQCMGLVIFEGGVFVAVIFEPRFRSLDPFGGSLPRDRAPADEPIGVACNNTIHGCTHQQELDNEMYVAFAWICPELLVVRSDGRYVENSVSGLKRLKVLLKKSICAFFGWSAILLVTV